LAQVLPSAQEAQALDKEVRDKEIRKWKIILGNMLNAAPEGHILTTTFTGASMHLSNLSLSN